MKPLKDAKADFEKDYLTEVLRAARGQVSKAARMAGRNRTEFYKLLNQHGLNPADFRGDGGQDDVSEADETPTGESLNAESTSDDPSPD